jgi:Ricin-type beta-trefoil lectin domain-like
MLRRILAGLVLACATSVGLGLAVSVPANAAGPIVVIRNTGNGNCLQTTGGPADIGTPVVQEPCDGSAAQNWTLVPLSDGSEQFANQATGDCLDARGGAANGTPVQQWTCNTISNEKWAAAVPFPVVTQVVSRVSGATSHCLDDPGQSAQDGTAMQIFACNGTPAQVWFIG